MTSKFKISPELEAELRHYREVERPRLYREKRAKEMAPLLKEQAAEEAARLKRAEAARKFHLLDPTRVSRIDGKAIDTGYYVGMTDGRVVFGRLHEAKVLTKRGLEVLQRLLARRGIRGLEPQLIIRRGAVKS